MRTGTQPINPHGHRSNVTQREPRRDCFASTGLPAMTSCHGLRLLASLLPPIRVASRHAARVGDERDHRGEDHGDGAGDHGLHRFPPLAWALGRRDPGRAGPSPARRREPSAIAPPTHAAAPAAHAAGTALSCNLLVDSGMAGTCSRYAQMRCPPTSTRRLERRDAGERRRDREG